MELYPLTMCYFIERTQKCTKLFFNHYLISDPNIIYVGAAFPESEFGKNFSKELVYPRNPIDISTSFPDSYIGEITKETGGLGYKKFLKEVLKSAEYKNLVFSLPPEIESS